jgi:acetylornithine deacetylase/succinyl-diaminopimelate desuccinylase-like protein
VDPIQAYLQANRERFVAELRTFCQIPSITSDRKATEEAAQYVISWLEQLGIQYEVYPQEGGNPILLGTYPSSGQRRLLFYNHYDVQPPDPLDEWHSPPFEARLTDDGRIIARGVADNKANLLSRLFALEAILATESQPGADLVFLIEGEEEAGSPHLFAFVRKHIDSLRADGAMWEAGEVDDDGRPILRLGQKGMLVVELQLRPLRSDLHSMWSPLVDNPGLQLMHTLMTLWDGNPASSRIALPGFYDNVVPHNARELAMLDDIPFPEEWYLSLFGLEAFRNRLQGTALKEALFYRPSINLDGFSTGHTSEGVKTVLPASARALIDIRLVPEQRVEDVLASLRTHFRSAPGLDIKAFSAHNPARTSPDTRIVQIAQEAARYAYSAEPIIQPTAIGSGPMWIFTNELGVPTVEGAGSGHPGRNIHAPNENIYVDNFLTCIQQVARLMQIF